VIYIHLFGDNFNDKFVFFLLIDQKQWREKKDEREKVNNVNMREKII